VSHPSNTLISAGELASQLGDPRLRIADVRWMLNQPDRGHDAYRSGHIAGAVFVDLDRDLGAAAPGRYPVGGRHPLPDPAAFAARMGELGFGNDHRIVAYDDANGTIAARLWWMLDDLGHPDVQVLDGGIPAWLALGLPVTAEVAPLAPAEMRLQNRWTRTIDREALASRLGDVRLLDARAGERYRGEVEPVDKVPGHIPTAVSASTAGNVGPDGRFLPAGALVDRFEALGAAGGDVVIYCGSGVTAAHNALALRAAGLPDPLLYDGSYSDWTAGGMPVATGSEPGEAPPRSA
jgi:thiosulfate/3-mercaptopyruvate sulfurtransferase